MDKTKKMLAASCAHFKSTRSIAAAALIAAVSAALGAVSIDFGSYIRISFSTIANQVAYMLFGPAFGAAFGGALDIIKYIIKPTGPYFPGFTLSAALGGLIYGSLLFDHKISLKRIAAAELIASVVCNMLLGTLWLHMLYGKAFLAIFPMRVAKNLVMWPINSLLFFAVANALKNMGISENFRRK